MPTTTILRKQVTPTGSIQPHGGGTAPDGFLVCDGTIVNIADYPKLFASIGTSWGYGNNDGLTFHLPDLRGRMLRGHDAGAGRDPDAGTRTSSNSGGNTGDNVGSVQGQATKKNGLTASTSGSAISAGSHSHNTEGDINVAINGTFIGGDLRPGNGKPLQANPWLAAGGAHAHTLSASTTINTGDLETRSINANVNYVIKAV